MLMRYNPIRVEDALRAAKKEPLIPPASDRAAWQALSALLPQPARAQIEALAEAARISPVPDIPVSAYREYNVSGGREAYELPWRQRRNALLALTLAECLFGDGRYLDAIAENLWRTCEETTWEMSAYSWAHGYALPHPAEISIDLGAAMIALQLAEVDALLGATLDPGWRKRIRYELDRRCFTPYLTRHDFFWMFPTETGVVNNWAAVCAAGVVGAAVHVMEDDARLAELIARACRSLDAYLAEFDPYGGSSEGIGYWNYGFGYYAALADLVARRTDGKIDLWNDERARNAARMPLRAMMSAGKYPTFSDCPPDVRLSAPLLTLLAKQLGITDFLHLADPNQDVINERDGNTLWGLRAVIWPAPAPTAPLALKPHDWFPGLQWLIARSDPADPDALVLAVKGGHNDEMHNHNDVGSFIVQIAGESVLTDIGAGRYDRDYFGPNRNELLPVSSLGHSVPVINGIPQGAGRLFASTVDDLGLGETETGVTLDLTNAYPKETGLESLHRRIVLHRTDPMESSWIELGDVARFSAGAEHLLESIVMTFGIAEITVPGEVIVRQNKASVKMHYDPSTTKAEIEILSNCALSGGEVSVTRVRFTAAGSSQESEQSIRLRMDAFLSHEQPL